MFAVEEEFAFAGPFLFSCSLVGLSAGDGVLGPSCEFACLCFLRFLVALPVSPSAFEGLGTSAASGSALALFREFW